MSWRGKALLAALSPLVFLGLLELGLRVGGFSLQESQALTQRFRARKAPGTVRIMVLGGSAAAGFPFSHDVGAVPLLRLLLRDVVDGQPTEVLNCAVNALTSEGVLLLARRFVAYDPDVLIVYSGHNEYFNDPNLNRAVAAWSPEAPAWHRRLRTFALLRDVIAAFRGGEPPEDGMTRAERAQAGTIGSPADYRPDTLAAPYEARLRELVKLALAQGSKVLLCTMASNLKDAVPTLPQHGRKLDEADAAAWRAAYATGRALASDGKHREAAAAFEQAMALDDGHAGLLFDYAGTLYAVGEYARARELFVAACDQDYMPMRATSARNAAVRRVSRILSVPLADADAALSAASPHGVPGDDLLFDHVHPAPAGAMALARCWARALEAHNLLGKQAAWNASHARSLSEYMGEMGVGPARLAEAHALIGQRCAEAEAGGRKVAAFRREQFVNGLRARGRAQFAAALRLDPHAVDSRLARFMPYTWGYIALAYNELGRPRDALKLCDTILDAMPGFMLAYVPKGEAHEALAETKQAVAARERARQLSSGRAAPDTGNTPPIRKETAP